MSEQRITVAHSPDSDDAFMFFGLASGQVETGGIVVEQVLQDIESLNRAAFDGKYEVTAVSFHAYAHLVDKYALLPHGASMGDKYGPIVVAPAFAPQGAPGSYGAAGVRGVTGVRPIVGEVADNSLAAQASLKTGALIQSIAGEPQNTPAQQGSYSKNRAHMGKRAIIFLSN